MRVYYCGVGNPKDSESNKALLNFAEYLESIDESDEQKIVMAHEMFRKHANLPNMIFSIGRDKQHTDAQIVYFDHEPDGKAHKVFIDDEKHPYIEVEDSEC